MKIYLLVLVTLAVFASKADSVYADEEAAEPSHVPPRSRCAAPYIMNSEVPHTMAYPVFPAEKAATPLHVAPRPQTCIGGHASQ